MNTNTPCRATAALHSLASMPLAFGLAGGLLAGTARADVVTDMNALVSTAPVAPRFGGPQQQARAIAMIQVAVHDALNAIDRRYDTYSVVPTAAANASPDAAVAAATRRATLALLDPLPPSVDKTNAINAVNAAFDGVLGAMPYDASEIAGIAAGNAAADAIVLARTGDGSATPHAPYVLGSGVGVYQPTPNPEFPAQIVPAFGAWGQVTPFVVRDAQQFRAGWSELLDVSGDTYARDYNEVKSVGDALVRGAAPDSARSDIARYWPGGGSNWNLSARTIVQGLGLSRWQHARLFALLNMAESDGLVTTMGAKYDYDFWRPVTAIRHPNDGNAATSSDATWRPFLVTPPYPDYPCALPTATGASTEVLRRFFGTDAIAFTRSFAAPAVPLPAPLVDLPGKTITRHFDSLSQAANESSVARVYAGIHFRSGCRAGVRSGTQVGRFVFQHALLPAK
jgi:hypothetical protein